MPEKAWLPARAGIHLSGGFLILVVYGLLDGTFGHASRGSFISSFLVLSFFVALLTWADVLKLWIEPAWDMTLAGLSWQRRVWHRFINGQIRIRRAIYATAEREHEKTSFMASAHLMWGAWLSYLLFYWLAPHDFHFRLFVTVCLVVSIADPFAAGVGSFCTMLKINGSLPSPWCRHKSWAGSLAFGAIAISLILFGLQPLNFTSYQTLKIAALGAGIGALCEAFAADQYWHKLPWVRLDDNLAVYLGLTITLIIALPQP